jgi:galactose mutarotase-like enzyme
VRDPASGVAIRADWPAPTKPGDGPYLNFWTRDAEVRMFCVEPFMTPLNALNHGHGLIVVPPGGKWEWWFRLEAKA